jgi:hypothetical protein
LVFSLPLPEVRKAIREFAALDGKPSGFHMWEITPKDPSGWSYRLDEAAEFTLVQLDGGNEQTPWANPPIGLRGKLLDDAGNPVQVTLKPLGCSLLRRTSFPLARDRESEE